MVRNLGPYFGEKITVTAQIINFKELASTIKVLLCNVEYNGVEICDHCWVDGEKIPLDADLNDYITFRCKPKHYKRADGSRDMTLEVLKVWEVKRERS